MFRTPITAIVLIYELTGIYALVLPTMICNFVSSYVSSLANHHTFFHVAYEQDQPLLDTLRFEVEEDVHEMVLLPLMGGTNEDGSNTENSEGYQTPLHLGFQSFMSNQSLSVNTVTNGLGQSVSFISNASSHARIGGNLARPSQGYNGIVPHDMTSRNSDAASTSGSVTPGEIAASHPSSRCTRQSDADFGLSISRRKDRSWSGFSSSSVTSSVFNGLKHGLENAVAGVQNSVQKSFAGGRVAAKSSPSSLTPSGVSPPFIAGDGASASFMSQMAGSVVQVGGQSFMVAPANFPSHLFQSSTTPNGSRKSSFAQNGESPESNQSPTGQSNAAGCSSGESLGSGHVAHPNAIPEAHEHQQ
jgi:hypothetical protein